MAVLCSLQGLWATAVLSPPGCFCTSTSVCTPVNTSPFHFYFPHQKWIISDVNFCSVPPCQHLKGHCPTPETELLLKSCPAMCLKELSPSTVTLLEQMRNRKPQLQVGLGFPAWHGPGALEFHRAPGYSHGSAKGKLRDAKSCNFSFTPSNAAHSFWLSLSTTIRFIFSHLDTVANAIHEAEAQFRLIQYRNKNISSGSSPKQLAWCVYNSCRSLLS